MKFNTKRWKYTVLSLLILIFSFWFYTHHYDILFDSKSTVIFKAINDETNQPIEYASITISRIEKPWYFMWEQHKVLNANTNNLGEFSFEISKSKRYYVELSKDYNKRFINDDQMHLGFDEFEGQDVADKDTIIIKCAKRIKIY